MVSKDLGFQQWRGRWGNLTQTGTAEGTSWVWSKFRVHWFRYSPWGPMKYRSFLNIRFLSSAASNTNTKKPLLTKWLFIPSLTSERHFLWTQASTAFGEGHKLVNWPMRPLSARFRAALQGCSVGIATVGIVAIFFTNCCWFSDAGLLLQAAARPRNVASSGGKVVSFSRPPPGAMALDLRSVLRLA